MFNRDYIETWLKNKNLEYTFFDFEEEVRSVEQASLQTGFPSNAFVKSLALKDPKGPFICIIPGNKILDKGKVASLLGVGKKKIKILRPAEVEKLVGFPAGGVPPIALECRVFVDKHVLSMETIIGGGGSTHVLLRIPSRAVLEMEQVQVAEICAPIS